jgi:hypothetical protein
MSILTMVDHEYIHAAVVGQWQGMMAVAAKFRTLQRQRMLSHEWFYVKKTSRGQNRLYVWPFKFHLHYRKTENFLRRNWYKSSLGENLFSALAERGTFLHIESLCRPAKMRSVPGPCSCCRDEKISTSSHCNDYDQIVPEHVEFYVVMKISPKLVESFWWQDMLWMQ